MLEHHEWIYPFMLGVTEGGPPKMNYTRIIEALIIAGVVAGITLYGNNAILSTKMEAIQASTTRIEAAQTQSQRDLLSHVQDNNRHR